MKTIDEIYQELLSCFGERTGLEPREGCDLSARLYAVAAQVYSLYVQADWVVRQAFPQTAEGTFLDRHAQLRGLERKPAVAAEGTVRFTAGEAAELPRDIPQGTVCMTAGLVRFETTRPAVLEAGKLTAEAPVRALEPGAAGNISAGAIVSMAVAPLGISFCANPRAFTGGADCPTGPTAPFTSRGRCPLTRWRPRRWWPGPGGLARWTWCPPLWPACPARSCWRS